VIFVDLDGHISDRALVAACEEVRGKVRHLEVLGSFPRPTGEG
jgi:prephenate dehydratase